MEYKTRQFIYRCKCGFSLMVHIDFGQPQEKIKCRKCSCMMSRTEL